MSLEQLDLYCTSKLEELKQKGIPKTAEKVIAKITLPDWVKKGTLPDVSEDKNFGPRYFSWRVMKVLTCS
jgi:glycine C-acetyltransferase